MPRDIKLTWDYEIYHAQMHFADNDIVSDYSLYTSIIISLFTDARAAEDDILPDERDTDRRGWWGDATNPDKEDDSLGSKLWLLERSKVTQQTLLNADQYIKDALQWMLDEGIAKEIKVLVENQTTEIGGTNILAFRIEVIKPDGKPESYRFEYEWLASAEDDGIV